MPIARAWRLCPHAIYLPVNFRVYEEVSARIRKILEKYADKLEQAGIEEWYLDVSKRVRSIEEAEELAIRIREKFLRRKDQPVQLA